MTSRGDTVISRLIASDIHKNYTVSCVGLYALHKLKPKYVSAAYTCNEFQLESRGLNH